VVLPLDPVRVILGGAVRYEESPDNAFDWFHTNVHDGGVLWKADATVFFRHASFGAIGPSARYMRLPRHGGAAGELAYGFTFGTRPGLKERSDLLLLQFLTSPSDDTFGFHVTRLPVFAMLIYRASFGLSTPAAVD
jgi:hypothetical protein